MANRNIRSSYERYLQTTDEPVELKTYLSLNSLYNKFLAEKALEGHEVTLPSRLGTLSIQGRKPTVRFENGKVIGLSPDWVGTKKLWDSNPIAKEKKTLLYHTNENTDGFRYKWVWSKKNILVSNKTLYTLKMTREHKRAVHSAILNGKQFKTL